MYSAVLMVALATASGAPDWHRGGGCCGASYSYGCGGCGGCSGCYGGCSGAWTYGGYGFAGGGASYHGGCYGAYGAFYGDPSGGCTGCYGCYGGYSCYGIPVPMISGAHVPVANVPQQDYFPPINPGVSRREDKEPEVIAPPPEKRKDVKRNPQPEQGGSIEPSAPIRAKVRIEVPVGGKLYVDGRHIDVAAGTRVFQTPPLAQGERYFYDVRIEVGQRSETSRVVIQPGEDVAVNFPTLRPQGTETAQGHR